jgi:hypothetical protein
MLVEQLTTSFSDGIGIAFKYIMHSKGNNSVSAKWLTAFFPKSKII